MEVVINEWLLESVRRDKDSPPWDLAVCVLNTVIRRRDKIVVRKSSPFLLKLCKYMKQLGQDPTCKNRLKQLDNLFHDSNVTRYVADANMSDLPGVVQEKNPGDDRYLVETAFCTVDRIIVTMDARLKAKLHDVEGLKILLPDEFLRMYSHS